jgi:hypothetical protein
MAALTYTWLVDDAQDRGAHGNSVTGLAQSARDQSIEGRQERGPHHRDPSLFGAPGRYINASR